MTRRDAKERKEATYERAMRLFKTYNKFALVGIENVVSTQLKDIKRQWGSDVEFLMGKNSAIKRAMADLGKPEITDILELIKGDVCFVFFKGDVRDIKKAIDENVREACAKVGNVAQKDVWVDNCITGMTPDKTSYFQVLGIATKITKGKVEIISPYKVLSEGDRVGPSQANLLGMLNIKPFSYKMTMHKVYENGVIYDSSLIDVEKEDILSTLRSAISSIAAISLGADVVTQASMPYNIRNTFKDILEISLGADFMIKEYSMVTAN
ncbi:60S acidic ribosomal protein P0 [Encephalitozoon hellem ATCC 50504]|uniref:Large ribosomal subunit protein uL10 n=1 Tax=Encephalitozoon hellem TaxID=27973 RepID=A0A9Q9C8Q5_ENCHE|nr:60S acidic ribosomal protein P0 [Encephalitozoon hellem ATCC 50504]AFM98606.1 60S acidic ribosomal protein P0 [Encephalitozoon hellem ATCC 50504]UTX43550.1 ribosomal protein L10 [Encephalitozoon hellem]WEL39024.1 ribosomal protein L10 [Encephalitozoon hellem]|eukprot:XP_003887587.1 60S acidic ribosomal protein P0 [Encephalitozoon hellem ATCC 50504]